MKLKKDTFNSRSEVEETKKINRSYDYIRTHKIGTYITYVKSSTNYTYMQ